jgi:hypothetical protein
VRPQRQAITHDEGRGQFGDCHRTCIAMILNMDRDNVPHFMDGCSNDWPRDHPAWEAAERAEIEWLAQHGLAPISIPYSGELPLADLLAQLERTSRGAPVVLGCTSSNGFDHSVVVHEGRIHNPNLSTVAGPMRDGMWWLTIYSVGPNWGCGVDREAQP